MANIFDYISWRGDLTFRQDHLNCIDALIFSQMAYFPFDHLWDESEDGNITISEAHRRLVKRQEAGQRVTFHLSKDEKLFAAMAKSRRFGSLPLAWYENSLEPAAEKQFAAVTVLLPEGAFLAFRGTDHSLTGWNEDFNMSFTTPVPAQIDAAKYFARAADRVSGEINLGGHSKGGNLAVYAALFCSEQLRNRISSVYNNDGPGFDETVVSGEMFELLRGRLHTFLPQSSVVGLLLNHEEGYTVVSSRQIGLLQHDLYSWELQGKDFICLEAVTEGSLFVDRTLKTWLADLSPQQRSRVVEAVFDVLYATEADTFREMVADPLRHSGRILKSMKDTDPETKQIVKKAVLLLLQAARKNLIVK